MRKLIIGFVIGSAVMFGQGNSQSEHVRGLNNVVLQHHAKIQTAGPGDPVIGAQAAPDIRQREAALAALIESDPAEALKNAFSADLIDLLGQEFPDSAAHFEKHATFKGVIETVVADDLKLKTGTTIRRLKTDRGSLNVYFSGPEPKLKSGMTITVAGMQAGGNVAAEGGVAYDSTGGPAGMACGDTGAQNIATILVNLPDYTLAPNVNADFMAGVLYGNAYSSAQNTPNWSVDDFWQQNSDGQTSAPYVGGTTVGPLQLASDFNTDSTGAAYCDYQSLMQAAINAADPFLNFQNFSRVVIVFPYNGSCAWAGLGSIGCWLNSSPRAGSFTSSVAWLRSDQMTNRGTAVQLASHELGHGLGLHHASTRDFSVPSPRVPAGQLNTQGTWIEYGDVFSAMGYWSFGLYDSSQAQEILGWLGPNNYQTVSNSGQYSVQAYETRNASNMVKALKILRDAGSNSWIWLEYRTNQGDYDSQLNSQVWSGALLHYEDSFTNVHSNLLDLTSTTSTFTDPALAVGQTWTDSYTNLSITVNGISGNTLNVTVNYGAPPCVHANPTVVLSPPNPSVNGGSSTTYSLTVTNNDTPACTSSTFALASAQPSGFTGTLSPTSLTINPGATAAASLAEKAGTTLGTYPISVAATSTSNSTYTATGTANLTVSGYCLPASPTITFSPANASVLPGGSKALTVTVKNNNSPVCSQARFALASPQPSGFTGSLSSTSLNIKSGSSSSMTLTETAGPTLGSFPITVTATNSASVDYAGMGSTTLNVVPCTLANPTISLSPATAYVAPSGSVAFTLSVLNNNVSVCPAATFTLASPQPTGLSARLSSTSVSVASGAKATITLTETASSTANGPFTVPVTATNSASPTYSASATATLNVAPCVLANPTVILSPATSALNFSGAEKLTATIINNNSLTCASAKFTLAASVLPSTGLSTSLSASSVTLASGANTTATLTETASTTAGTYAISLKAANYSNSTYTSTGAASLAVVATTVAVTTDASTYLPLSTVTMSATVAGATPIAGASVTFTLTKPSGSSTTFTATTNSSGIAVWKYTLSSTDPNGTYTASAVATVSRTKYTSPAVTFAVSP